ncbi:hypothetical protein [Coprobacter tertius]|uniref:Outer membrane protein beta-barrel domain-containing protein n=1 Tax=Coprobacter tertius TaxID=2944915 RepID=A0ABT1MJ44_9BACT|nr:hypothetical protein [Coprobacter tertius]MCP9612650.1 hypothetical protein [Coprobacter tertius]
MNDYGVLDNKLQTEVLAQSNNSGNDSGGTTVPGYPGGTTIPNSGSTTINWGDWSGIIGGSVTGGELKLDFKLEYEYRNVTIGGQVTTKLFPKACVPYVGLSCKIKF